MKIKHLSLTALLLLSGVCGLNAAPLSLEDAVNAALKNNPGLQAANSQVEVKDYEQNTAMARMLPSVTGKYTYAHLEKPKEYFLPQISPVTGQITSPNVTYLPLASKENYKTSVAVTQPLFTGGQLFNAYKIAGNEKQVAELSRAQSTRELKLAVINSYYDVLVARKYHEVAVSARDTVNSHVKVAQAFYAQGMIPKNDLLVAQVRSAESEQNLIKADNGTRMADSVFNMILSRDLATPVEIVDLIDHPTLGADLNAATAKAFEQRQELATLQLQMNTASRAVRIAEAAFGPTVGASVEWEKTRVERPDTGDAHNWTAALGLEWKLFDGSANYWNLKKAKTQKSQLDYLYQLQRDQVSLEVKNAFLKAQEAGARITVASKAIDQAKENLRIEKDRFNLQMATSTDVLDAQTTLTDAERNLISARADYAKAAAELNSATGTL